MDNSFFAGKKAIVTGASQGIGHDVCKALHAAGTIVYALSRNADKLKTLEKSHPGIVPKVVDVRDVQALESTLHEIGPVDFLVNNAGIAIIRPLLEHSIEDFNDIMNTNTRAAFFATKSVAGMMIKNGVKGSIVNVSSCAALRVPRNHSIYAASKFALDGITVASAVELGEFGIRVNSVNPTVVLTEMGINIWGETNKDFCQEIPLGKFVQVQDVVNSIMFLLSDKSSMITGTSLPLEGGLSRTMRSIK